MKIIFEFVFIVLLLSCISGHNNSVVEEVFSWSKIEYESLPKSEYAQVGPYRYYIPENNNIGSFGYHPASGIFIVTIDRLRPGIPTSLGAFCVNDYNLTSNTNSPKFWGFPNYRINELQDYHFWSIKARHNENAVLNKLQDFTPVEEYNSKSYIDRNPQWHQTSFYKKQSFKKIISVFHLTIDDKCNRVFFMDNGQVQYYQNTTHIMQKPALWAITLPENGCETRSFPTDRHAELPDNVAAKGSNGFVHVFLDYQLGNSCDDLFVYTTNTFYNHLTVYDYSKHEFWTIHHQTFEPVVSESYFIFDKTFHYQMNMGLYSMSLGYPDKFGDRTAYYTLTAGTAQYEVSTKVFKDRNYSANQKPDDFRIMGYRGCNHQSFKTVIDYTHGVMFYSEIQTNQLRCWNIKKPLNPDNIGIVFESEYFDSGLQTFVDSKGHLWFYSSQMPILLTSDLPLDLNKVNNRIFRTKVSYAIRGTVCE
ncbi:L-dopachrome tautomerase yellow-f2-like [Phlebotomus argentipes]|uniref:L-dopachrome tautomerase yellow-f2-like n=1 Tax=Phlebotomus argentipes TaxID=94469 RepID=UPI002892ED70|nr:L-dopachrome tautomerase yellow-f2-like [Phlebotomus argentipes]